MLPLVFAVRVLPVPVFTVFVGIFFVLPPICRLSPRRERTLAMVAKVTIVAFRQCVPGCDRVIIAVGQLQKIEIFGSARCLGMVGVRLSWLYRNTWPAEIGVATNAPVQR